MSDDENEPVFSEISLDPAYIALCLAKADDGYWHLVGALDVGESFVTIAKFKCKDHGIFFAQQMQKITGETPLISGEAPE